MTKKVLFTAKVDQHIWNFHIPYLKYFKERGFTVHVASHGELNLPYVDEKFALPLLTSPTQLKRGLTAFRKLRRLIRENHYDVVHCHTPIPGVLTRLAALTARNNGTQVLYTAHGFHFYKGAPLSHWLLYFPIEKGLARVTDTLITINDEDYHNAVRYRFKAKQCRLLPGIGVDVDHFSPNAFRGKNELRRTYGFQPDDYILIFVAELNANKHQDLLIEMAGELKDKIPGLKLLLVGTGDMSITYQTMTRDQGLTGVVQFLGHRQDIGALLKLSDVAVSSSKREGLPVNILEAMAMALPIIVTDSRGNRDLIEHGQNGLIVHDLQELVEAVYTLYQSSERRQVFGNVNRDKVDRYALKRVLHEMESIYGDLPLAGESGKVEISHE